MRTIDGSNILAMIRACLKDDETLQGWEIVVDGDNTMLIVYKQKMDNESYLCKIKFWDVKGQVMKCDKSTQGICPKCGKDLEYTGDHLATDIGHDESVLCQNCGWDGYEIYRETFEGTT